MKLHHMKTSYEYAVQTANKIFDVKVDYIALTINWKNNKSEDDNHVAANV